MKTTTKISINTIKYMFGLIVIATLLGSCSLAGLDVQEDFEYNYKVLDPKINMTARQFLESRSYDPKGDSVFYLMRQGLEYAGIDLSEFEQPDRTFIFLHKDAILRLDKGKVTGDCYFGYYKVANKPATKWSDYPKEQVKNWFLYLIAKGNHTFETLGPDNKTITTLLPLEADPKNPQSEMVIKVINDRNSKLRINEFVGATRVTTVRTGGIISTNGPIHVVDRVVAY
jgi:hypothetical protein